MHRNVRRWGLIVNYMLSKDIDIPTVKNRRSGSGCYNPDLVNKTGPGTMFTITGTVSDTGIVISKEFDLGNSRAEHWYRGYYRTHELEYILLWMGQNKFKAGDVMVVAKHDPATTTLRQYLVKHMSDGMHHYIKTSRSRTVVRIRVIMKGMGLL